MGCRSFAGYAAGTVFFPGIFMIITGVMLFITDGIKKGEVKISEAGFFEAVVIGSSGTVKMRNGHYSLSAVWI